MTAHLVDHVAFWVPTFISHVPVDLHKLLENRTVAAGAFGCESCRVVEVAINVAVVFVVRVLRAEKCRTERACEMLDVILFVCCQQVNEFPEGDRRKDALQAVM